MSEYVNAEVAAVIRAEQPHDPY